MTAGDSSAHAAKPVPAYLEAPPTTWVMPPPVETRSQELPLGALSWENFERLCLRLARLEASIEFCRSYGVAGQEQGGIDIYARRESATKYKVYQCKRVVGFGPAKIRDAVTAFLKGEWINKAETFALCTKESLTSARRTQEVEKQRARLHKKGIGLDILDSHEFSSRLKDLPHIVSDFFGSAWAQAFCGPGPARSRQECMDEATRASRARCVERWVAAGVLKSLASEFADNASLGVPQTGIPLPNGGRVILITGDIGAGKSLLAERLLQAAITGFAEQPNAPIPVFLPARVATGSLETAARDASQEIGDARAQGAFIVIDGADEMGSSRADDLVSSARVLANTWPQTTIVITSRVLPRVAMDDEVVQVPPIPEADALVLIGRVAGKQVTTAEAFAWPESVRQAICRPLYGILLASYLRERTPEMNWSISTLLASLASRSLRRLSVSESVAARAAEKLAMLSTDRDGGPVPLAEVGSESEVRALIDSGMVVEHRGAISFPLPILTQWFAAKSLQRGSPRSEELLDTAARLEAWRYALVIAVGSFSHDEVARILKPIVAVSPAFASLLITEGLGGWSLEEEVPPPHPVESGKRIREAMLTWLQALGRLAGLIAPVQQDGSLRTLGVHVDGAWLTSAWYKGTKDLPPIVEISVDELHTYEWPHMAARPGRQSGWAWRWTLRELTNKLRPLVDKRVLPSDHEVLRREAAWVLALTLTGQGSLNHTPIPLDRIETALIRFPSDYDKYRSMQDAFRLRCLRAEVARIRGEGSTHLLPLWPGPDSDPRGSPWVWSAFSADQIRLCGEGVYRGALEAYKALVEQWFGRHADRLDIYPLLPVRIVGEVRAPARDESVSLRPIVAWYFEPLLSGQESVAEFQLVDNLSPMTFNELEALSSRLRAARPEAGPWVSFSYSRDVLDVFDATPATELCYNWLREDLRRVHWLT